jgi:RNase P subunit RPR2
MKKSKLALIGAILKSKVQAILGWTLMMFFVAGISIELSADAPDPFGVVMSLVCLAVGVLLLVFSFRTKNLVARFRLYVNVLSKQSSMSIYELAMTLGETENRVMSALQAMIDRRFFASAYIDKKQKRLVFPLMEEKAQQIREEQEALPHVIATCSICGAEARVPVGKHCNCMYCDNLIQG